MIYFFIVLLVVIIFLAFQETPAWTDGFFFLGIIGSIIGIFVSIGIQNGS